ncbi:dCTP deaminase [candidate division KSB1 bacterium]|nr:dCTP deaminase [candidate division KSB1 bacterium]
MILSDKTIREYMKQGRLSVEPIDDVQIQPGSVDLRLGDHFLKMEHQEGVMLQLSQKPRYEDIITEEIIISPHSYILATTREYVKLPDNVAAFVQGRSSLGRMGVFLQNSGWVDPGFEGEITFGLFNANNVPVKLTSGVRICQLVFAQLDQTAQRPYRGKYQGQRNATGSRVSLDADLKPDNLE